MQQADLVNAVTDASRGHVDLLGREMLQKLASLEPEKRIVPTPQVTNRVGKELVNWKLAAEAELTSNFLNNCATGTANSHHAHRTK